MLKYSHIWGADLISIAEQLTPSKCWIYRNLSSCWLVSRHPVILNWHGCYSAYLYVLGRVWAVTVPPVVFQCRLQKLEFLQWHTSVGPLQLSFSSGIPVWDCFNYVCPVVFQCTLQVFAGSPSGIPVYTGSTSGIPVAFQCTLDLPVYTGSG